MPYSETDRRAVTHLIPRSSFLPFVASVFQEALPGGNRFLVYGTDVVPDLAYGVSAELIPSSDADVDSVVEQMAGSDVAVVHNLSTFSAQVLARLPDSTLRVWSGFGGDYYGSRLDPMAGLLGRATARRERRRDRLVDRVLRAHSTWYVDSLARRAAAATDVFSAPVPTDLAVFRRRFRGFRGSYRQLNYASVEDTYATAPDRVTGEDILVGNSATAENNHLEVFARLRQLDLGARRIIAPLSYGDPSYADDVVTAGTEIFGDRFSALRDYLPLAEYNRIVAGAGVVVMGHRRQQALGNVARAVWQGAHVYLDERSPILSYFREIGLPAGTLEELSHTGLPAAPSGDRELDETRAVARAIWGRDVVVENIRELLRDAAIDV